MVRAMCGVRLKDRKSERCSAGVGFNEAISYSGMQNIAHGYEDVLF